MREFRGTRISILGKIHRNLGNYPSSLNLTVSSSFVFNLQSLLLTFANCIAKPTMASRELKTRIMDLEEATWRALQKSGEALIPFLTDDCIMQFPMGMKLTSTSDPSVQDVLYSEAFIPWKTFELLDIDVTPVGDSAVISYLAQATRPPTEAGGRDAEFDALCCSVWRWDGEKFAMCFHQQTLAGS